MTRFKAWWVCLKNPAHECQQVAQNRLAHGCPICRREAALAKSSLINAFPEISKQWHRTKNGFLTPEQVMRGSSKRVWWQCEKNIEHIYQARICDKTSRPVGCPDCKKETRKTLASVHPDLAAQWHPLKNKELRPDEVQCSSRLSVWWRCTQSEAHEWQGKISQRIYGSSDCPYCSGYFLTDDKRLSICFPDLAAEWHPSKNRFLRPRIEGSWAPENNRRILLQENGTRNRRLTAADLSFGSSELIWWRCKKDRAHEWQAKVVDRTNKGSGCPFCVNKRVTADNNLKAEYPSVAKLWHPTRNLPMTAAQIVPGSMNKVWWRCAKSATHVWQAAVCTLVAQRRKGKRGCPFCAGKKVDQGNSLQANYPGIAKLWHPDRNLPLLPSQVPPMANKSVWWRCSKNKTHVWQAKVATITRSWEGGTNGCPYCAGRRVAYETSLSALFPEVAARWHYERNDPLLPSQVTAGSNRTVWWQCQTKLTHEWQAKITSVVRLHKGGTSGCPYCYGIKASPENNFMAKYPEIAAQWHSNKNLPVQPWQVTPGSNKLVWWFCPEGSTHVWQARVKDFVKCKINGTSGCPHCRTMVQPKSRSKSDSDNQRIKKSR